ncbi:MAG: PqqD family protein [Bacteroidales bacterium]|nr:PqqD family protein [Bacteroidales bacterium]
MKLKDGFGLRTVCGEKVLVAEGIENIDYSKIISLNETAAFLWENLEGKDFQVEDMVDLLTRDYDVPTDVAFNDCSELLKQWIDAELVIK